MRGWASWPSATRATSQEVSVSGWRWRSSRTEGSAPVVVALDEPTRGMDREAKAQLAEELHRRAGRARR